MVIGHLLPTLSHCLVLTSTNYRYTGIEQLAAQLRTEPDQNKRLQLYGQIQTQIATDIPVIPTIYPKVVLGMRKGIDPFPVDIWYYPLWRMTVTK